MQHERSLTPYTVPTTAELDAVARLAQVLELTAALALAFGLPLLLGVAA